MPLKPNSLIALKKTGQIARVIATHTYPENGQKIVSFRLPGQDPLWQPESEFRDPTPEEAARLFKAI